MRNVVVNQPWNAENACHAQPPGATKPGVRNATQRMAEPMKMFCASAFLLPRDLRRDDPAATRGEGPEQRDERFAPQEDDDGPERDDAEQGERGRSRLPEIDGVDGDEGGDEQQLVGQRVDHLAEGRDLAAGPGQVSVPQVRERGDDEHDERDHAGRRAGLQEQRRHDGGREDPARGNRVREIQCGSPPSSLVSSLASTLSRLSRTAAARLRRSGRSSHAR